MEHLPEEDFNPYRAYTRTNLIWGLPLFIVAFWLILFLSPIPRTDISNLLGGVFLFLIPVITLILLVIFILVAYFTRYISLASITAAFLLPIFTFFTHRDSYLFALSVIIAIFVIYRHKTNISRLLSGTENKFKF